MAMEERKGKKRQWLAVAVVEVTGRRERSSGASGHGFSNLERLASGDMPNAEGRRHASLHVGKELELGKRVFWVYVGAVVVSSTFVVLDSSSAMSMPLLGVRIRRRCSM